ncbi:MAG: hypothetical protein IJE73_05550 [Muribaculaceae bacterium]|nr:hypothetical protein [Muribaculaceae bacterium]
MKTNLLKSFITILFALIISQQVVHAQTNRSACLEAQLELYDIVNKLSEVKGVDFGGICYENISYDCETLKMDIIISTSQSDIRYLTSDMLTLQFHTLVNTHNQREYYSNLSSLLRQANSKWQMTYKDSQGHAVSHIFTPDDIDDMMTKSVEELGIDKEQMSNYCIFFHNNLLQKQIDGVNVISAKATKEGNCVKTSILTTFDDETIKFLTPEIIKQSYIGSIGSRVLIHGYANQLKAFGFDGLILEYSNQLGATAKATITVDDFLHFYDDAQLGSQDVVEEEVFEAYDTIAADSITCVEIVDDTRFDENKEVKDLSEVIENEAQLGSAENNYSLSQNSYVLETIEQYKKHYQSSIGTGGILDIKVELLDPYIAITIIVDGVNDNAGNYAPNSYKEHFIASTISSDERIEQYKLLYAEGVKGFYMTISNAYDYISFSVPIDLEELFSAKYASTQAPEQSLEEYLASLSEEEKQAYTSSFMQDLDEITNSWIGSNGVINTHTYIANNYINIICNVNSIEGYTDEFINQSKINYIKEIKPNYNEEIVTSLKYILEVKGYKFIYTDATTHKSVSLIVDFDEILHFNDEYQYNDEYDFSDLNTEEIINGLVLEFDKALRPNVGQDGLVNLYTTLRDGLIETTFIFDNSVDLNDIGDINTFKNELLKEMTATQDDLDTWEALYYFGIEGFKFIFRQEGSNKGKWLTITIDDVINGIDNLYNIPLNEI